MSDTKTAVAEHKTYYTSKELSEELGLSHTTIDAWLKDNGGEGRVRSTGMRGVQPMEYEITPKQLAICKAEQQQQLQIKQALDFAGKKLEQQDKRIAKLTAGDSSAMEVIQAEMRTAIENAGTEADFLAMARKMAEQMAANAASIMRGAHNILEKKQLRIEELEEVNMALSDKVLQLEETVADQALRLDMREGEATVMAWANRKGYDIDIAYAAAITKWLHKQGRKETCKAICPYTKYPACVWKLEDIEYAEGKGIFEQAAKKSIDARAERAKKAVIS